MEKGLLKVKKLDRLIANKEKKGHHHLPGVIDKFLKWAPLISVLAIEATGVKAKHDFKKRLAISAAADTLLNVIVEPVKHTVDRQRPNHSLRGQSFPSSHTATAFLGAEILHQELKASGKAFSYAGYLIASTAGALRIYNNKHWFSDVIAGAAIGILAGKLTYALLNKLEQESKSIPNGQ